MGILSVLETVYTSIHQRKTREIIGNLVRISAFFQPDVPKYILYGHAQFEEEENYKKYSIVFAMHLTYFLIIFSNSFPA